jgi:hypothetical protein
MTQKINYARLWSEVITEDQRDYAHDNPEVLQPGYWLIKKRKRFAPLPARIYWCDHEPGNPENKLDRWPLPFLAGEIAGEPADPEDIFGARERITMVPRDGLTIEETYKFLIAEMHWARQHAPNDAAARPQRHLADLTNLDPIGPP